MIPKSLNGKRYFIADRFHGRVGTFIKMQCFVNEALPSEFETIYGEADYRQMPSRLLRFCLNLKTLEDSKMLLKMSSHLQHMILMNNVYMSSVFQNFSNTKLTFFSHKL
ncbi:hypothetical protein P3S67_008528 [Capsicum chacoense]